MKKIQNLNHLQEVTVDGFTGRYWLVEFVTETSGELDNTWSNILGVCIDEGGRFQAFTLECLRVHPYPPPKSS